MGPWSRPDGKPVEGLQPLRRFLPLLLPRRNDAAIYLEQRVEVGPLLRALAAENAGRAEGAAPLRLFTVIAHALTQTLTERPALRRYVAGGRIWQRDEIVIAFAVKKAMDDDAGLTTVLLRLPLGATLREVVAAMATATAQGRGGAKLTAERELDVVTRLPLFAVRLLLRLQATLDGLGLLPGALLRSDPMYASVFCSNLGSVGLDAPFHHLFNYGTCPIFLTIGKVHRAPVVAADGESIVAADVVRLCWSYDERIADGFYAARSLERFSELLRSAQALEPAAPTVVAGATSGSATTSA